MSYQVVAFTSSGVLVADGAVAAANMVAAAVSGEAVVFVIKTADGMVPAIEIVKNIGDLQTVTANAVAGNLNANIKESFASALGMMAAAAALGAGPAVALAFDHFMSEKFKDAYDSASSWSTQQDWSPLFDLIDRLLAENEVPVSPLNFDPEMYRVPGLPSVIDPICTRDFHTATATRPPVRRDPLAIDLDGDGIETVGITATPVLFDHNADGIKTGTGWLKADDAWLALDRDGNGTIDSGSELFGADTVLSGTPGVDAVYASTGFQALQTLDSNHDNVFDANDAAFTQVRIWQDSNQDGISQSTELFTLAQENIASIGLNASTTTTNLGNGNVLSGTATVTRSNGTTTTAATVGVANDTTAANLNLVGNPFYREFTDPITLSTQAEGLPDMQGSGWVRDLREAMSLGTPQGAALAAKMQDFANATTKDAQMALLDDVLRLWAETNPLHAVPGPNDPARRFVLSGDTLTSAKLQAFIPVLEVFNGMNVTDAGMQAPTVNNGVSTYTIFANQAPIMLSAYESLRQSVYGALVVQTRLKPYLDAVELQIDATGVHFDVTATIAMVQSETVVDPVNAVTDLIDLQKYASTTTSAIGWQPYQTLGDILEAMTITPEIQGLLDAERIVSIGATGTSLTATNAAGWTVLGNSNANAIVGAGGADQLFGFAGNDTLTAVGAGDTLDGGDGDDALSISGTLYGGVGTTYIGGKGNDTMSGNWASDTYVFNLGDGQDTINEYSYSYYSQTDVLKFGAGIAPTDVTPVRSGLDLVFKVGAGSDQITVKNWFADSGNLYQIEQVKFADGTVWSNAQVNTVALEVFGTAGADTLSGVTMFADVLRGGAGNDTLTAVGAGDTLDGGDGDDALSISGTLYGGVGTTYIGGKGNDTMSANWASDTYVFNLGDGQDTIYETSSTSYAQTDVLKFGAGIAPTDVTPVRSGLDLVFNLAGGSDQITVKNWFADSGNLYQIEQVKFADGTVWSNAQVNTVALEVFGTGGADTLSGVTMFADVLRGGAGNDTLTAVGAGDTLDGGDGDDALSISGTLYGGVGTTYIGGKGNDTMSANWASDTYVFNLGDGQDTIYETSSTSYAQTDVLKFGAGIAPTDVTPVRSGLDLVFNLAGGSDQITVKNWFADSGNLYQIEQVKFADGTVWSNAQVNTVALEVFGTGGADTLSGVTMFADVLRGGAGNDTLTAVGAGDTLDGGDGDDALSISGTLYGGVGTTYIGGKGNDTMSANWASDTYVFNLGDGQDTIYETNSTSYAQTDVLKFGAGIAPTDVTPVRSGLDLVFKVGAGSDQITVKNWFADSGNLYQIEQVKFADGTVWSNAQVNTRAGSVLGTLGADTLTGTAAFADVLSGLAGNDTLTAVGAGDLLDGGDGDDALSISGTLYGGVGTTYIGGKGNDTMSANWASDTYVFNLGDGQDTIYETSSTSYAQTDVLKFGAGIAVGDVTPVRSGQDLVFKVGTGTDQITVKNWFADGNGIYQIEQITFADGTSWSKTQVNTRALEVFGTAGADSLTGVVAFADVLRGGAGNDTLVAVGAGDTLDGGDGDDSLSVSGQLYGGTGTTYIGGKGNDTMSANWASDTYVFNLGDGQDTIYETSSTSYAQTDVLKFGAGIAVGDVTPVRSGQDLVFKVGTGTDQITVKNWFADGNGIYQIEQITFADGTSWSKTQVNTRALEVFGTAGADSLTGVVAFADVLRGGAGNDTLVAVGAGDTLDGGDGDDSLSVSGQLYGGTGTTYIGGKGNDTMSANWASDTYVFNLGDGQDTIYETSSTSYAQTDVLKFGAGIAVGDVTPVRSGQDLVFKVGTGTDQITVKNWFADGNGIYQIEQITFADGTSWSKTQVNTRALEVFGTAGADSLTGVVAFADVLRGGAGNDTLVAVGAGDTLDGGDGDDSLSVSGQLYGGTGTTYIGGKGNDTMSANWASDTYVFNLGDGQDTIYETSSTSYAQTDVLKFGAGIAVGDVTPVRSGQDLVFKVGTGTDQITVKNWFADGNGIYQIEQITFADGTSWSKTQVNTRALEVFGTAGADSLTGVVAFADVLRGGAGNDTLVAVGAGDTLDGGDGDDSLSVSGQLYGGTGTTYIGGKGNDTMSANWASDTYVFNLGDGQDTIYETSSTSYAQTDVLKFGAGIAVGDVTPVRSGQDLVFKVGTGTDQITVKNWFADGNGIYQIEQITFADGTSWSKTQVNTRALEVFGTAGADSLTGVVAFADVLRGGAGNDTLVAVGAGDTLDGGDGDDSLSVSGQLYGGTGTTYIGGKGNDTMSANWASDTYVFNLGDGQDTIYETSSTSYAQTDVLKFGAGIAVGDVTPVRSGVDLVFKLAGGTDQITVKNWFSSAYYQIEQVQFNDGTVWTAARTEAGIRTSLVGTTGADTLVGTAASDEITGLDGADTLTGQGGHDLLDGGTGADVMTGGAGDDVYVVDNTGDTVTELSGEGRDTVRASLTYTLGAEVEDLILTGTTAINGTGNALVNALYGNRANNILNGGAGADTLYGGLGNDTYVVDNVADTVTEAASEGTDTVQSAVSWTLGNNLENLTLTGSAVINGTGNTADNALTGNSAANTLTGNAGNDTLNGGAGADSLVGGTGNDTYWLGRGHGIDTISENDATVGNTDLARFDTGIAVDQLWFTRTGNNLDVSIIGTTDKFTLSNWYLGNQYHVEQFKTSDGKTLLDSQVQNLVSAMAAFAPPPAGQTTLTGAIATTLAPVIAANWQ